MSDSPAVILFDSYGREIALADGYQITVDTRGIPIIIVDQNDNAKIARSDADGYLLSSSRITESLPTGTNIIGKTGIDSENTGGLSLETTQIDSYNKLDSLESKDFATETTLISIKDTDGIKKITEPVAVTDNESSLTIDSTQLPASMGQTVMAESSPVTIASDQLPPANDVTTGEITELDGYVVVAAQGWSSCMVILSGTWVGTLRFEISSDEGISWIPGAFVTPPAVLSPMPVPTLTVGQNGTYQGIGLGAVTHIRVKAISYTSGTIGVRMVISSAVPGLFGSFSAIQQNVVASLYNNSDTPLDAFEVFTGTGESTLGVAGIQVNIFTDQNSQIDGLEIQQSIDNVNWDIIDTRNIYANEGVGITYQATASYFRIIYRNGSIAQSIFRLQAVLCPVVEALPRSLGTKQSCDSLAVTMASDQEPISVLAEPNADSETLFESRTISSEILIELKRIRMLLEVLTDEKIEEHEVED